MEKKKSMGREQRPHSAGSSPDGFCLRLGPLERLRRILVGLQQVVLTSAVTEAASVTAAGGCRKVRAGAWLLSAAHGYGVKGLGPRRQLLRAAVSGHLGTS